MFAIAFLTPGADHYLISQYMVVDMNPLDYGVYGLRWIIYKQFNISRNYLKILG
jgi:hypothetical protein